MSSNYRTGESAHLFDQNGNWVGVVDQNGLETLVPKTVVDPLTGGISLSGGAADINTALIPRITCLSSCSILGDSILAYGNNGGQTYSNSHISWANDLLSANGAGIDITGFYAVAGSTLDDVIASQLASAVADSSAISWVHCGINNISSSSAHNDSVAALLTKAESVVSALSAVKKLVIFDALDPVNQAGSTGAKGRAFQIPMINAALNQMCAKYGNVVFNDTYSDMIDTTSASLNPLANYVLSADGIHFQSLGAWAAGKGSANRIGQRARFVKYKNVGANLLPPFAGTGGTTTPGTGTVTGTPPVNWNCQVVNGSAAVTISTTAPDMIRFTMTNAGGATSVVYIQATNNAALTSALAAGGLLQGSFGFQASGITNISRIAATLRLNGSTPLILGTSEDTTNETTVIYPTNAFGGRRKTMPYQVSAGSSNVEYIIAVKLGATTGTLTLDVFDPELNLLT